MAEFVKVAVGDTICSIVASRKSPHCHEMRAWIEKVVKVNPHIVNPDKIYPNEYLLIPDSLNEHISEVGSPVGLSTAKPHNKGSYKTVQRE